MRGYGLEARIPFGAANDYNSSCQLSYRWIVTFYKSGKDKAAKGEGWAPLFICCARGTIGP